MSTITTIAAGDQITNSRADINTNFSNLNTDKIETSVLDTDTSLAANSDSKVATQKAVKAYVDTGGNVNASTTAKGIVEEATAAEVLAGTATGGTGARLYVNPASVAFKVPIIRKYLLADSPATWTKPAGLNYLTVEMVGGGAGGGGSNNAGTSAPGGSGGGSGSYGRWIIPAASLGSTETITVGSAGTGSSASNGTDGGSSSVGTLAIAGGGVKGIVAGNTGPGRGVGGAGGVASGSVTASFSVSQAGDGFTAAVGTSPLQSGGGGDNPWGTGGQANIAAATDAHTGRVGLGYGAGGGGGLDSNGNTAGGAGTSGAVVVTEYYV